MFAVAVLLACLLATPALATPLVTITLDDFGGASKTVGTLTIPLDHAVPISGGGVAFDWQGTFPSPGWGIGGDLTSGAVLFLDQLGHVQGSLVFNNVGAVSLYTDGSAGFDAPADPTSYRRSRVCPAAPGAWICCIRSTSMRCRSQPRGCSCWSRSCLPCSS